MRQRAYTSFYLLLLLAIALVALAPLAWSHEFWLSGKAVDPQTKFYCCGESDCKLLPVTAAHARAEGYYLDDTGETIPWSRVQPSPDGAFWVCRWGAVELGEGTTKCFFAPVPGA